MNIVFVYIYCNKDIYLYINPCCPGKNDQTASREGQRLRKMEMSCFTFGAGIYPLSSSNIVFNQKSR